MSEKFKTIVSLPSYNEARNLPNLFRDIHQAFPEALVLVVDDGSVDETENIARKAAETMNVLVVKHQRNMGLGQAIRTAFTTALDLVRDDGYVIIMDADGTHRPGQIPDLIIKAEAGADLVVVGRYLEDSIVMGVPYHRRMLSAGVRVLSYVLLGNLMAKDVSSSYRLYKASLLRRAERAYGDQLIVSNGFTVSLELLVKMVRIGARIDQIPLNLRYDMKKGPSKIRIIRTVIQYLRLFWYLAFTRPLSVLDDNAASRENTRGK
jgi:dolichol-phosphate mannosyltransferase